MDAKTARVLLSRNGVQIEKDDSLLTYLLLSDVVLKGVLDPFRRPDKDDMQAILRSKGVRLSDDDPIFTLLTLNSIVLHEAVDKVRRAHLKKPFKTVATGAFKTLLLSSIGFGLGVFFGMGHLEPSRVFSASVGFFLGLVFGALAIQIFSARKDVHLN